MSPELAFVAACCRWPDDDERRKAVDSAAAQVSDWQAVLALTDAHRVEGLVAQAVSAGPIDVPADVAAALARRRSDVRAAALRQVGETLRLSRALAEAGIAHAVLKGVPLGISAYGTSTIKHSWDIDLLVLPEQTMAAVTLLRGLGYQPMEPVRTFGPEEFERWAVTTKELILESPEDLVVELHWRVSDHPMLLTGLDARAAATEVPIIGAHAVPSFSVAQNLAYLSVHGAFHGWSRLKWLADFAALLGAQPADSRAALLAEARTYQPRLALDQAVQLSRDLVGLAGPVLPAGERLERLVSLGRKVIAARVANREIEADPSAQRMIRAAQWLIRPEHRYRLLLALRWVRGSEDRKHFALPARLAFGYWLMRPFTALYRFARRRIAAAR